MILIIQHAYNEGPGLFKKFFQQNGLNIHIVNLERGAALPGSLDGIRAVMSMGGPMNVYQEKEYPFLRDEDVFLKRAFDADIPVLGICLGAQLMAKAMGATVKKARLTEIGWQKLSLTGAAAADPLFAGLGNTLDVFQFHGDAFELPPRAQLLACNEVCPQVYKTGKHSYGLQCHVEVTPEMVINWILDSPPGFDRDTIIAESLRRETQFIKQACTLCENFCKMLI